MSFFLLIPTLFGAFVTYMTTSVIDDTEEVASDDSLSQPQPLEGANQAEANGAVSSQGLMVGGDDLSETETVSHQNDADAEDTADAEYEAIAYEQGADMAALGLNDAVMAGYMAFDALTEAADAQDLGVNNDDMHAIAQSAAMPYRDNL